MTCGIIVFVSVWIENSSTEFVRLGAISTTEFVRLDSLIGLERTIESREEWNKEMMDVSPEEESGLKGNKCS